MAEYSFGRMFGVGKPCCAFPHPLFYALVVSKGAMELEMWEVSRGYGLWNPRFNRAFNILELEFIHNFFGLLNTKKANP